MRRRASLALSMIEAMGTPFAGKFCGEMMMGVFA
jgi:hypothetical protein